MPSTYLTQTDPKSFFDNQTNETLKTMTVIKRSGVIVPFRVERIANAIEGAVRETYEKATNEELPFELKKIIQDVTASVVEELCHLSKQGRSITVEGIQDIAEQKLMDQGHHSVAKNYIIYRDKHSEQRKHKENLFPQVIRDDQKTIVRFNPIKIGSSIEHAFRLASQIEGPTPEDVLEIVNELSQIVIQNLLDQKTEEPISTNDIQEEIENELMAHGYFKVAKQLILQHNIKERPKPVLHAQEQQEDLKAFVVAPFLKEIFSFATKDFKIDPQALIEKTLTLTFEGITQKETYAAAVLATKERIEFEPEYAFVAARVLLDGIYRETLSTPASNKNIKSIHRNYFIQYIKSSAEKDSRLNSKLKDFDLEKLAAALDLDKDLKFSYLGLQTLYDRYFIHKD